MAFILNQFVFQPPKHAEDYLETNYKKKQEFITIDTKKGPVYAYYFPTKPEHNETRTIIYSHGNACDISQCYEYVKLLRDKLRFNVLHYEYHGYGPSTRIAPSEEGVFECADAAMQYVLGTLKVPQEEVIVYGTSLGSAPTVYLASKYKRVKGCILECPFTSIVRTKTNFVLGNLVDMFLNYSRIGQVEAKVLIFHGTEDNVVPVEHGKELYNSAKNKYMLKLVEKAGHNNIREKFGYKQYLVTIYEFIVKTVPKRETQEQQAPPTQHQ